MSSNIKYPRSGQHIGCTYFQSPLNYVRKPTELRSCLLLFVEVELVFHIKGITKFEGTGEEVQTKKISVSTRLEEDEGSCIVRTFMICTAQKVLWRWSYQGGWRSGGVLQDLTRRGLHAGFWRINLKGRHNLANMGHRIEHSSIKETYWEGVVRIHQTQDRDKQQQAVKIRGLEL